MSQQWWKARPPERRQRGRRRRPGSDACARLRRHGAGHSAAGPGWRGPKRGHRGRRSTLAAGGRRAIEEAAIRFAHGDDAGAEAILLQALAPDTPGAEHDETWRALLDLYRATGDAEKFSARPLAMRSASSIRRPNGCRCALLARDAQAAAVGRQAGGAGWPRRRLARPAATHAREPGRTDPGARRGRCGVDARLERARDASMPDAAGPLRALFAHWAGCRCSCALPAATGCLTCSRA